MAGARSVCSLLLECRLATAIVQEFTLTQLPSLWLSMRGCSADRRGIRAATDAELAICDACASACKSDTDMALVIDVSTCTSSTGIRGRNQWRAPEVVSRTVCGHGLQPPSLDDFMK